MDPEDMIRLIGWAIVAVFVLGALVASCGALVNDDDSLGPIWATATYDGPG